MNTVEFGRLGEAAVLKHFVSEGYEIFSPLFGNTSIDLIVIKEGKVFRVEVKTTKFAKGSSYEVQLRSSRPNRTGTTIRKFDGNRCDLLAIYVEPEDRVIVKTAKDLDGRSTISIKKNNGRANPIGEGPSLEN